MDHDNFRPALLEKRARGVAQSHRVERAIRLTNLKPGGLAGFDLIENAVVDVLEGRRDNFCKPITVLADRIDARLQTGFLRRGEQAGGFRAELRVRLIEFIKQQEVTQVKD